MDEIQVASKHNQTICKVFSKANLLNKQYLLEHDIKILELTATPDGTLYDLLKWGKHSCKVMMLYSPKYIGSFNLYEQKRLKQFMPLCYDDKASSHEIEAVELNVEELLRDIQQFNTPRYHIIRTRNGYQHKITIHIIKDRANSAMLYYTYDESQLENINLTLIKKPTQHTIIFIKEKLRCAKTLVKTYLGVLSERYVPDPDDSVIIQGLVGRLNGYDLNDDAICYTNIESVIKYNQLWNHKFENMKSTQWASKTTLKEKLVKTFNGAIQGFSSIDAKDTSEREPTIIKRKTQQEIRTYFQQVLKPLHPSWKGYKFITEINGFYPSYYHNQRIILPSETLYRSRRSGLTHKSHRYYACYGDVNDKDTVEFWLMYYP